MRPVCSAEPKFEDSTTMTASQMADGSHTLKIRLVEGVTRSFHILAIRSAALDCRGGCQ